MQVSGKITHSFYCFLQVREFDMSRLYALTDLEMEFLKDPSQWLPIDLVESFLKKIEREYAGHFAEKDFLSRVGRSCFELSAWGDLDSVLKIKSDQPVFSNLPVFLSYFISDGFSLVKEREDPPILSFKGNLSSEDFPFVTEYLRSALSALPIYTGKNRAEVKWIRNYIQIEWEDTDRQASLFSESLNINIKPEILKDLRHFLERVEKELYHQRQKIREKDKEIRNLQDQLLWHGQPPLESQAESLVIYILKDMEQNLLALKSSAVFANKGKPLETTKIKALLKNLSQLKAKLKIP